MWPGGINAPLETVMVSVMCQLGWDNEESRYLVKPHSVCMCVCVCGVWLFLDEIYICIDRLRRACCPP